MFACVCVYIDARYGWRMLRVICSVTNCSGALPSAITELRVVGARAYVVIYLFIRALRVPLVGSGGGGAATTEWRRLRSAGCVRRRASSCVVVVVSIMKPLLLWRNVSLMPLRLLRVSPEMNAVAVCAHCVLYMRI